MTNACKSELWLATASKVLPFTAPPYWFAPHFLSISPLPFLFSLRALVPPWWLAAGPGSAGDCARFFRVVLLCFVFAHRSENKSNFQCLQAQAPISSFRNVCVVPRVCTSAGFMGVSSEHCAFALGDVSRHPSHGPAPWSAPIWPLVVGDGAHVRSGVALRDGAPVGSYQFCCHDAMLRGGAPHARSSSCAQMLVGPRIFCCAVLWARLGSVNPSSVTASLSILWAWLDARLNSKL